MPDLPEDATRENLESVSEARTVETPQRSPWRVGRKVGRTIYALVGGEPSDEDELIGVMDSRAVASAAVEAHNASLRPWSLWGSFPTAEQIAAMERANLSFWVKDFDYRTVKASTNFARGYFAALAAVQPGSSESDLSAVKQKERA